jgi:hypothetical protein
MKEGFNKGKKYKKYKRLKQEQKDMYNVPRKKNQN